MTREDFKDSCAFMFENFTPALIQGTSYIKDNGYKAPTSSNDTFWQHAYKAPGVPLWEYFQKFEPLMGKVSIASQPPSPHFWSYVAAWHKDRSADMNHRLTLQTAIR